MFEPSANWPLYHFKERSYSRWATERIINDIITSSNDPFEVMAAFVRRVDGFRGLGNAGDEVFGVAYDVGLDILSLFGKEGLL